MSVLVSWLVKKIFPAVKLILTINVGLCTSECNPTFSSFPWYSDMRRWAARSIHSYDAKGTGNPRNIIDPVTCNYFYSKAF